MLPRARASRLSAILLAAALAPLLAAAPDPRITRVEHGLLPPLPVASERPWDLQERMRRYRVPGVSVAVLDRGRIVWAKAYGYADLASKRPVTVATPFQAGRAGLLPMTLGALRLVDQRVLGLDQDINRVLKSWQLPAPGDPAWAPVTLRDLLGFSAGLAGGGTKGYPQGAALPTPVQILDGAAPAGNDPVRRHRPPGPGLMPVTPNPLVVQLAMADATGEAFPALMARLVFQPLGMAGSSYAQPGAGDPAFPTGYLEDGSPVPGRFHRHPQAADQGLWTTPSDLLRAALELQRAARGRGRILSAGSAAAMLTPRMAQPFASSHWFGLGLGLERPDGATLYAVNGGATEGFQCSFVFNPDTGQGAAVMWNREAPGDLGGEILRAIAAEYRWPGYLRPARTVVLDPGRAEALAGRYLIHGDAALELRARGGRAFLVEGEAEVPLFPLTQNLFMRTDQDVTYLAASPWDLQRFEGGKLERAGRTSDPAPTPSELLRQGQLDQALAAFRALHKREPSDAGVGADHLWTLAAHWSTQGQAGTAVALQELNVEFHPGLAWAWYRLALYDERDGQGGRAREAYRKVLELVDQDATLSRSDRDLLREGATTGLAGPHGQAPAEAPDPAAR